MFLFRRAGYYHVEYLDGGPGKKRRVSTHSTSKADALKFVAGLKEKITDSAEPDAITISQYAKEYVEFLESTHSHNYAKDAEWAFSSLLKFKGDGLLHDLDVRELDRFFTVRFAKAKHNGARVYRTLKASLNQALKSNNRAIYF